MAIDADGWLSASWWHDDWSPADGYGRSDTMLDLAPCLTVGQARLGAGIRYRSEGVTRSWYDVDSGRIVTELENRSDGVEVVGVAAIAHAIGPVTLTARGGYATSGLRWGIDAAYAWSDVRVGIGWRSYPGDGWYSGPVFSIGATF